MCLVAAAPRRYGRGEPAVRAALAPAGPRVPAFAVQSMDETLGQSLRQEKFTDVLLAVFGAISLLLAAAGIYGVVSLEVTSRVKELAIRMAIGARPRGGVRPGDASRAKVAATGLIAGLAGALALTRLLGGLLFEVTPTDTVTFVTVTAILTLVALLASLVRAPRQPVDPMSPCARLISAARPRTAAGPRGRWRAGRRRALLRPQRDHRGRRAWRRRAGTSVATSEMIATSAATTP